MRSHYCGQLNESLIDATVTLCGWVHRRRDHGGVIFLDLRDREGVAQIVIDPDTVEAFARAEKVRSEFVLKITGRVRFRPEGTQNSEMLAQTYISGPPAPLPPITKSAGIWPLWGTRRCMRAPRNSWRRVARNVW